MTESIRLGSDVGNEEQLNRRDEIEIYGDRDPLPENLMPVVEGATNECHFLEEWGHDRLCHRRVAAGGQNVELKIKLDPGEQVGKLELFETL